MKITMGITFYFCLLIFISCTSVSKSNDLEKPIIFDYKTFTEQRKLWRGVNADNYQYQLFAIGFNSYYGTLFVENGKYKYDTPLDSYFEINDFLDYSTIDKIYSTVERMFETNKSREQSEKTVYMTEIFVEYDKKNHIPLTIKYIFHIPPEVAFDGTTEYKIINFQKME